MSKTPKFGTPEFDEVGKRVLERARAMREGDYMEDGKLAKQRNKEGAAYLKELERGLRALPAGVDRTRYVDALVELRPGLLRTSVDQNLNVPARDSIAFMRKLDVPNEVFNRDNRSYAWEEPHRFVQINEGLAHAPVYLAPGGYGSDPRSTAVSNPQLQNDYTGPATRRYEYSGNFFRNTDPDVPLSEYKVDVTGVRVPVADITSADAARRAAEFLVAAHGTDGTINGMNAERIAAELYSHSVGDTVRPAQYGLLSVAEPIVKGVAKFVDASRKGWEKTSDALNSAADFVGSTAVNFSQHVVADVDPGDDTRVGKRDMPLYKTGLALSGLGKGRARADMEDLGIQVRQAAKGGDVAPDADPAVSDKPPAEEREPSPGPSAPARIIINPKVFKDKRDGLCVAYNEAFRVIMEMNGFDPQAEPTEEQRKFFSDTAYADDERMLRRTILARICTFDDSVKNPTDEQLDEALEFLETVMEIGAPQSEEEQANVQRIHDMIAEIRKAPRQEEQPAEQPVGSEAPPVAAVGGGYSSSEERWADRRAGIGTMQSRDENGRLSGSNWMRDENGRLPGSATEAHASEEARAEGDNLKEGLKFDNPKDKAFGGEVFPGDPAAPLGVDEDGGEDEIPGLVGDAPMAQAGAAAPAENPGVTLGRRADGSLAEGSLRDQRDENGRIVGATRMRDEEGRLIHGGIRGGHARKTSWRPRAFAGT